LCRLCLQSRNCFSYVEISKFDADTFVNPFSYLLNCWHSIQEVIATLPICSSVFPILSVLLVVVSNFRSYIEIFGLFSIDINAEWKGSIFTFLHVDVQFSQHHLLKRISFLQSIFLGSFVKNQVGVTALIYFWVFCSIGLCVCISKILVSVVSS
jgi:hypothetical protein